MKVSKIIQKSILKYISKEQIDDFDVCGIRDEYQYFLILNTKEIFNTTNETKVYMIMEDNEIQGLVFYAGWCGYYCDFNIEDNSISIA